jgi:teichoic acid glycerol-phosphate primase
MCAKPVVESGCIDLCFHDKIAIMAAAGLIFDHSLVYLDHLAPFCALQKWPLILCDPNLCEQASYFYPDLTVLHAEPIGLGQWIEKRFTHLVTCTPRSLLHAALGKTSLHTLWLPHGQSDKGQIVPFFDLLREEETVLLYGQKMVDLLTRLQILQEIPHVVRVGHFRWTYYQKMRTFYDTLPLGFSFPQRQMTMLYAPTWEDQEQNSSFWQALPILAKHLPKEINLLVKPHPNTVAREGPRLEFLSGNMTRSNLQFLLGTPPILPLLERCDLYLGDRSSIGYDMLLFDKPLFFLDPHMHPSGRDLLFCGLSVTPHNVYQKIQAPDVLSARRRTMASYAFD